LFNFDNNQESSWNLQDGYKSLTDSYSGNKSIYPRRVEGAGIFYGLFIGLKSKISNYDYVCKGPAQKFLVAFHLPSEIPRLTKQYFSVPLQNHVTVQIKPMMMTTDKELKNYDPILRQCFFNDERYLKFFKTYTQNNCEIECLSNYTLGRCGCVAFWMPRDKLTKVCDYRKKSCAGFESESELYGDKYKLKKILKSNVFKGKFEPCNCLPSCTSISYDTEISQAPYSSEAERIFYENVKLSFAKTLEGYESSRLLIMFKESQFITKKRSEVYGLTSFMANCGGLLGKI
jgi:acid-sensing ion channel, other